MIGMKFEIDNTKTKNLFGKFSLSLFVILFFTQFQAQSLEFVENKGQWHPSVKFRSNFVGGSVFLHKNGNTFNLYDVKKLREIHHDEHHNEEGPKHNSKNQLINQHAYNVTFVNGEINRFEFEQKNNHHYNYFLGNDQSKWASNAASFSKVSGIDVYPNIDVSYYSSNGHLKYDFVVHPQANAGLINLKFTGQDNLSISNGKLIVKTTLGDVIEQAPYIYQEINGVRKEIVGEYVLQNNIVSFSIGEYDKSHDLIIDPVVLASTYSGSTEEIWGHTATYDDAGNIYSAGAGFSPGGLPTTMGAYQTSYQGSREMCIHKYNPDGSVLLYGTYLGGLDDDYPHSLYNYQGNLYVLGSSSSSNFPTTSSAYDQTYNGSSDIVVSKFSVNGFTLEGSTYVGGNDDDGTNSIYMNYGDDFRGEIVVDGSGNCYIASMTSSSNFPTSSAAYQSSLGGSQDGVTFKLNPSLSNLMFSTYLGGNNDDAAYGVKVGNGVVYVAGSASSNFLGTGGAFGYNGGMDGFLVAINQSGSSIQNKTYFGSSDDDQAFFVEIDLNQDVYILGQTEGVVSATSGKYNGGNGLFITKFNPSLTNRIYTTTTKEIAPIAFLVDDCGFIYASGHSGLGGLSGFDITPNAVQTSSGGFYLLGLTPDATTLNFGSYYGASDSHVDGGTSRFDKRGVIYQATCTDAGFPTLGNAWSMNQNGGGYDVTVFKIDFEISQIKAVGVPQPDTVGCAPYLANFSNTSGGNKYFWDFGDGSPVSNDKYPTHLYNNPGVYNIRLIAIDSISTCVKPDTAYMTLTVFAPDDSITVSNDTVVCNGNGVQLSVSGAATYEWSPAAGLSNPFSATPTANPTVTTTYRVIGTSMCNTDTAFVTVTVDGVAINIVDDTTICLGESANLWATGGSIYSWTPPSSLSDPLSSSTIATPSITTTYSVEVTNSLGCSSTEQVTVNVQQDLPNPISSADVTKCPSDQVIISSSGGDSYFWSSTEAITDPTNNQITAEANQTTTYYVDLTNACGTVQDTVIVFVQKPTLLTSPDKEVCFNDTIQLWVTGASSYAWSPSLKVDNPFNDTVNTMPIIPTTYTVVGTDSVGCMDTAIINIAISPIPELYIGEDQVINYGESVDLSPTYTPGEVSWSPEPTLHCIDCIDNVASPETTIPYVAFLEDQFGCIVSDTVIIGVDGAIYVANAFTPDNDGHNDVFYVKGEDITEYQLYIFNRWGDLLFESNDMNEGWDGKFKGEFVKLDTYVWRLIYSDINTTNEIKTGHVSVVR